MNKYSILFALAFVFAMASCEKDADPTPAGVEISFNFSSPTENYMYPLGDTVNITGRITANVEMHGYEIEIINTSDNNKQIFYSHTHEDGVSFDVSEYWVNNVTSHSNLILTVTAILSHEMDSESNEVSKSYYFMAHPM